jgi:hypothetical protein
MKKIKRNKVSKLCSASFECPQAKEFVLEVFNNGETGRNLGQVINQLNDRLRSEARNIGKSNHEEMIFVRNKLLIYFAADLLIMGLAYQANDQDFRKFMFNELIESQKKLYEYQDAFLHPSYRIELTVFGCDEVMAPFVELQTKSASNYAVN